MIHPQSEVQTNSIGANTLVWQYTVILKGAKVGNNCNINCHVFIENDVIIGDNVTVKSGVYIWDGIEIENNVFIGPNVSFTNDKRPRSRQYPQNFQKIVIRDFASIGAGAIILGGCEIGKYSMVGAGSLVNKHVPERALVYGSPAKILGWLNTDGSKMIKKGDIYIDSDGCFWEVKNGLLIRK
jgi:UDP-2-acetamido-3-amino-2,3-dideoxy-glucuronate N-acetyltransferase